jgi:hypothetical protein
MNSRSPVPATGCLRRRFGGHLLLFLLTATSFALPAYSQTPCDFKGVSVGDKLTREQLMRRLGISTFKIDPPDSSRNNSDSKEHEKYWREVEKYGIIGAAERQEDKTGPYCHDDYCRVPFGITIGDDNIPVKVFAAFKGEMVYTIEVSFNSIFWGDIWGILTKKYGLAWEVERYNIAVTEYNSHKFDQLERIIATHKSGGTNPQTRDTCSLSATNIDIMFYHHDSLGTLHAIFAIKREPKDF